jgi:hypothetical protein
VTDAQQHYEDLARVGCAEQAFPYKGLSPGGTPQPPDPLDTPAQVHWPVGLGEPREGCETMWWVYRDGRWVRNSRPENWEATP